MERRAALLAAYVGAWPQQGFEILESHGGRSGSRSPQAQI